ncbi:hypothetical protein [Eubacterium coprostanoligenes]|uniref:hypothetical protein n=1 Tax=Eubacterium coprostanoligenes TaxID=290054 RepID=UPI0023579FF7|nr:hypothetical protein [Eubacterium coprostanoligenes]MCI6353971.1 hypothetical protein [Eubacterium coprostanoligenes]
MNYSKEEQLKAAYALNLCTVSISQIIDYDDMNIMEQEYEAILNNLNLEQIPKDDALLKVLKQILDTITFFRIQEVDKKLIEKEYQQKIKNAIWNAVPNFGMIVAGGNPVTMAISLASQVGIGYMNYRKVKAEIQLDKERKDWELEASAIEQFNGLRRELFDTAWRLSDTYKFEDSFRLTEKQIKQYNTILMDTDPIRRYERLNAIKDNFKAYPQFWYYFGHSASEISTLIKADEDLKSQYKKLALSHFETFEKINKYDILREDQLSSSCALEHIDLLDPINDKDKILGLIDTAIKKSGNACDILQLCAIDYLKIGEPFKAMPLFKYLTNEDYNKITNAQFLSSLYVFDYITNKNIESKNSYRLLETRVSSEYLYPFPTSSTTSNSELNEKYFATQRDIVVSQYYEFLRLLHNKYEIKYHKVIPVIKKKNASNDMLFTDTMMSRRFEVVKAISEKANKWNEYVYELSQIELAESYLEIFNELYLSVCSLNIFSSESQKTKLKVAIDTGIRSVITKWVFAQKNLNDETYDYTIGDFEILMEITFDSVVDEFFEELKDIINITINEKNTVNDFIKMQNMLQKKCEEEGFPNPEIFMVENENNNQLAVSSPEVFSLNNFLVGEGLRKELDNLDIIKNIKKYIVAYTDRIILDDKKCEMLISNTRDGKKGFQRYFNRSMFMVQDRTKAKEKDLLGSNVKEQAIAVLNDKLKSNNNDLVFTKTGVYPIIKNKIKPFVAYSEIDAGEKLILGDCSIETNDIYDIFAIKDMVEKIADIL